MQRRPDSAASHATSDTDRLARIERLKRTERESTDRLKQLFRESDQHYQAAVRRLAEFDQMLSEIRSALARQGYLK